MFVTFQAHQGEKFDKFCLLSEARAREIIKVKDETLQTEDVRDYYEKPRGLVSVWRLFEDIGFKCIHSFEIICPVPVMRDSITHPVYLLSGHSDEIFWFSTVTDTLQA